MVVCFSIYEIFCWLAEKLYSSFFSNFIHLSERETQAGGTEVASARAAVSAAHSVG